MSPDGLGPEPSYGPGWADDPMGGLARWYAPDGVTHISAREANELLAARRHIASTVVGPFWISTVFLVLDHGIAMPGRPAVPVLWATMAFGADRSQRDVPDDVVELTDRRHRSLPSALAWHDQATAALADHLGLPREQLVHDPEVAASPAARGLRDWRG